MDSLEIANTAGRRLSPACQDSPSACPMGTARAFQRCASQSLRRGVRVWLTALVLTCWVVRDDETGTIASPAWRLWPRTGRDSPRGHQTCTIGKTAFSSIGPPTAGWAG